MAKGWRDFATINRIESAYFTLDKDGYSRPMTSNEKKAKQREENKTFFYMMSVVAEQEAKRFGQLVAEAEEREKAKAKARKKKRKANDANAAWKKEKQQRHLDTIKALKTQSDK